jgi:hypothetical protein
MDPEYPFQTTEQLETELMELQAEVAFQHAFQGELAERVLSAHEGQDYESAANYADIHDDTNVLKASLQYKADEVEAHIMDRAFDVERYRKLRERQSANASSLGAAALAAYTTLSTGELTGSISEHGILPTLLEPPLRRLLFLKHIRHINVNPPLTSQKPVNDLQQKYYVQSLNNKY